MTQHDHREKVPGCFRCDLSSDEVQATSEAPKRWQERGIWELMKAADPRLREELMTAWAERDAALAKIQRIEEAVQILAAPGSSILPPDHQPCEKAMTTLVVLALTAILAGPEDRNERCPS